jgi:hypothetical protein
MEAAIEIPGLPGKWRPMKARYDYEGFMCICPLCRQVGMIPWCGWASCDACGDCVALVKDGRAFERVVEPA